MSYRDINELIESLNYIHDSASELTDSWDIDSFIESKETLLKTLASSGIQIDEELRDKINAANNNYDLKSFCNEIGFKIIDYIKENENNTFYRNLRQVPDGRDLNRLLHRIEYYADSVSDFIKESGLNIEYQEVTDMILDNGIENDLIKNAINSNFNLLEDDEKSDFFSGMHAGNPLSMYIFNAIDDYEAKRQFIKNSYFTSINPDVFYQDEKLQSTVLLKQLSSNDYFEEDIERILKNNPNMSINLSADEMNEYVNGLKSAIDEGHTEDRDSFELKKKAFSIISKESKIKYLKDNLENIANPLDEFNSSELKSLILAYGSMAATMTENDLEQIRIRQIFKSKIRSIF